MFALTRRLTLRPGWPEDATALTQAIAHRSVVDRLAHVPWPYTVDDAAAYLGQPRDAQTAQFVILDRTGAVATLIGTIGIHARGDEQVFGYWLTPDAWGRGYATEAGRAVIAIARHALPIRRLSASWFVDNPASGRVLGKLGFRDTGRREPQPCLARGGAFEAVMMELDLVDDGPALSLAA